MPENLGKKEEDRAIVHRGLKCFLNVKKKRGGGILRKMMFASENEINVAVQSLFRGRTHSQFAL